MGSRVSPAKRFAIIHHKGGAGKTTVTVGLAAALAETRRVLVVDCDAQGNASSLLLPGHESRRYGVPHLFTPAGVSSADVVVPSDFPNIDLLPCDARLNEVDVTHDFARDERVFALSDAVAEIETNYDVVLYDGSPARHLSSYAAIVGTDEVLVPCQPSVFSLEGLPSIQREVESAKAFNPWVQVRYFLSRVPRRGRAEDHCRAALVHQFGREAVCQTVIPELATFNSANNAGKPVTMHAPRSLAAECVRQLAAEILEEREANGGHRGETAA